MKSLLEPDAKWQWKVAKMVKFNHIHIIGLAV